jgi:ABC-type glycerol-3-phosphate transport system permease component
VVRAVTRRRVAFGAFLYTVLSAWALIILFPVAWMVLTSFKDAGDWVSRRRAGSRSSNDYLIDRKVKWIGTLDQVRTCAPESARRRASR